jgi:hypothetical protein
MTDAELADLRQTYTQRTLLEADVLPDAVRQFRQWLDEAVAAQLPEPAALTLATVDAATGQPSQRVLLLAFCSIPTTTRARATSWRPSRWPRSTSFGPASSAKCG